jgi:hypothetical protein
MSLLSRIIDDGPSNGGTEVENILKKTFQNLPRADDIYKSLRGIRESIRVTINELRGVYREIKKEITEAKPSPKQMEEDLESKKWEKPIKRVFESRRGALLRLRDEVEEIIKTVDNLREDINLDWDSDINRIWDIEDRAHRPKKRKKCRL